MKRMNVFLFVSVVMVTGCGPQKEKKLIDAKYLMGIGDYHLLEQRVKAFADGADECLLDVRDRGLKWSESENCRGLGTLSKAYLEVGGDSVNEPSYIQAKGKSALATSWSARACESLGGGMQFLW